MGELGLKTRSMPWEPFRPAEIHHQCNASGRDRDERGRARRRAQPSIAARVGTGREQRRARRQATQEEVARYRRSPHWRLDDLAPVVGAVLAVGHRRRPVNTSRAPATSAPAAASAADQVRASLRRHDRIRRQPVHLGFVEQEEERAAPPTPSWSSSP
jgi:hypothetical protein